MATIMLYKRVPDRQIRNDVPEIVKQIKGWFKKNPNRRTCRAQMWYGRVEKVKPTDIEATVKRVADETIADNKAARAQRAKRK